MVTPLISLPVSTARIAVDEGLAAVVDSKEVVARMRKTLGVQKPIRARVKTWVKKQVVYLFQNRLYCLSTA